MTASRPWALAAALAALAVLGGCGGGPAPGPQPAIRLVSQTAISFLYDQGIARVPGGWILSGTNLPVPGSDRLVRTDEHFHVLVRNQPAIPPAWRAQGYDHLGDIDVVGDVVYVPFEQPDYAKGEQATARYDAATLAFLDAVVVPQHQNSFVAVDPASLVAYSMDGFDGSSLLRYDVAHGWRPLPPLPLSTLVHHVQGASVGAGSIWLSTSDPANDLYRVSLANGRVTWIGRHGHPGGEGEGIDVSALPSGYIHTLIVDPDGLEVWVENFALR
ncbi:MAG TPA: hypothetical protein VEI83_01600 [Acidimicrobiales bacterium]|nr:hypothetical protein [Acidimicrobiales bacterium]